MCSGISKTIQLKQGFVRNQAIGHLAARGLENEAANKALGSLKTDPNSSDRRRPRLLRGLEVLQRNPNIGGKTFRCKALK